MNQDDWNKELIVLETKEINPDPLDLDDLPF
jgi:hypothetical protein